MSILSLPEQEAQRLLLDKFKNPCEFLNLLLPLLHLLGWKKNIKHLLINLPHQKNTFGLDGLLQTLDKLMFGYHRQRVKIKKLIDHPLPIVFIPKNQSAVIITEINRDHATAIDSTTQQTLALTNFNQKGISYSFKKKENNKFSWFKKNILNKLVSLSLCVTVLILSLIFLCVLFFKNLDHINLVSALPFALGASFVLLIINILHLYSFKKINQYKNNIITQIWQIITSNFFGLHPEKIEKNHRHFYLVHTLLSGFKSFKIEKSVVMIFVLPWYPLLIISLFYYTPNIAFFLSGLFLLGLLSCSFVQKKVNQKLIKSYQNITEQAIFYRDCQENKIQMKLLCTTMSINNQYQALTEKSIQAIDQYTTLVHSAKNILTLICSFLIITFISSQPNPLILVLGLIISYYGYQIIYSYYCLSPIIAYCVALLKLEQTLSSEANNNKKNAIDELITIDKGRVELSHLSFQYPLAQQPALYDVSLKIQENQLVGIVGNNGSGKSTLLKLLLKLYQPQSGHIYIDNSNLTHGDGESLRDQIAYLPQSHIYFPGTIEEYLAFQNPLYTHEEYYPILSDLELLDNILALPLKFKTRFQENPPHINKSFIQRLSLAGIALKPAKLFLLDEPTNYLDAHYYDLFLNILKQLRQRGTVLMVTHQERLLKLTDFNIHLVAGEIKR